MHTKARCMLDERIALASAFLTMFSLCAMAHSKLYAQEAEMVAIRASGCIVVDGELDEWVHAVPLALRERNDLSIEDGWMGAHDLSAQVYAMWVDDALYFAAHVTDDKISCRDVTSRDFKDSDYVRIYLDTKCDGGDALRDDDFAFIFIPTSPNGKPRVKLCAYENGFEHFGFPTHRIKIASKVHSRGYAIEVAIPTSIINFTPKVGAVIGYQVIIGDADEPNRRTHEMAWQHHESGYWYRPSAFGRLRFAEKLTPHLALKYSAHLVSLSTDAQVYADGRAVKIYARIPMPIASWNWRWRIAVASPDGKAMRIATGKLTRGAVRTITRTWRIPRNADDGSYELTLALLRDDIPTITVKRTHFIIARGIASRVRNAIASAESHLKVLRNANARWLAREFINASWRAYRNHDFATALRLARIAQAIQPHAPQYKHGARTSRHISVRIETPTYPIGPVFRAWGDRREQLERIKRYRFTAIRGGPVDVAEQLGIKVVCGIGWWGLPRELRKPLLSNRGEWRTQLGFLNVNFNYIPFRKWLEKHIPEVVRKVYGERRNILGFCVHNEFAYWAPGYYDYSEWTVARYRNWLIQRYGTIDALNRAWRTHYRDFTTIEPPRELPVKELANWIDWRTFTCWNFAEFFRFIADLVHRVRPDVPVASNFCATSSLDGWNLFELARLNDYIALDIYALSRWDANAAALDLLRSAAKAHNRPHYLWEYHAGPNNWIPKVTAYHIYVTTFQALARNLRGIIYYHWAPSGAGRERGIHGMCDSNQQPTERVTAGAEMASECQRLAHLLLRSRTPAKVAVLYSVPAIFYNVGMQKSAWEIINRVRRICQLLERIHVPFDLVEERQLKRLRTLGYNVLILSGAPLLDEADGKALIEFVRAGGAIIAFYGTAIANAHGFAYEVAPGVISRALGIRVISRKMQRVNRIIPCGTLAQRHGVVTPIPCNGVREQVEVTAHTVQVWARADGTQMPAITVNRFGRGCAIWLGCELPIENEQPIPDEVRALLRALLVESGARPPVELVNLTGETVEASLSEAYGNLLLYLIRRVERDVGAVKVFLRASAPRGIIAIYAGARRVERLPYQNVLDGIAFVVPRVDPATLVIVPRDMQPLIGLDAPEYAVAGVPFTATVTVDNFTDATLRVAMNLSAPQGWRIERLSDANVVIKPTGRGACSFKVTPPSGAPIDRFRLENVLTASATVQVRNDDGWRDVGALKCEQGVGIVPAIDFFAHYKGELLNSWQELAPPILRWGWGTDVYVPPPPPLPLGVEASIEVEVIPRTKIAKAHVRIDANGLEVHPNRFTVRGARKTKVMLKVRGKRRGRYAMVLRADYGAGELKCTVPITVRLERESLLPHLRDLERTKWHGAWRRRLPFVVGVRSAMLPDEPLQPVERAHARPRYIIAEVDAQRPATVVDASGRFVPFVWRDGKLLVPVLHSGAVSASAFIAYFDGMRNSGKPLIKFERGERTVKFITPAFDVEFDVISGAMMRIGVANEKEPLVTHAGLMLTHHLRKWRVHQDASHVANSFDSSATAIDGAVIVKGILGKGDDAVEYRETFRIMPSWIDVAIVIRNPSKMPLRIGEVAYQVRTKRMRPRIVRVEREWLPPQLWMAQLRDIADEHGRGIGFLLLHSYHRWGEAFAGFRSGIMRTTIALKRNITLDPNESISAKLRIIPHIGYATPSTLTPYELITAMGSIEVLPNES